jgi:FAD/FMN-containing dehydrogenase
MAWTNGLTGHVVVQDSPDYDQARRGFNARFSKFPAVIVYCRMVDDVANAIRWVHRQNMPFRIRGGGHSYEAYSLVDGGLIIDVSGLLTLQIDKAKSIARIGAGFRLLPLYEALWKYGVTIPGGSCPTVGISGLTLGGGYGFLSRLHGMTCDSLIGLDMIDARGNVIHASSKENSELFWACRGGGDGSFGVITSFTFRVHPIGDVSYFVWSWDFNNLEKVVYQWQAWAPHTDARLTSVLKLPANGLGNIGSIGVFTGPEKELRRIMRPVQEAMTPTTATFRSARWIEAARRLAGMPTQQSTFKNSSAYAYEPLSEEAVAVLRRQLITSPGTSNMVVLDAYGGAIARIASDETAFPHRKALFVMQYQSYWESEAEEAGNLHWIEQFRRAMLPYTRGAYRDYCDSQIVDWQKAYFAGNLDRLRQVKKAYDSENLFRFEQSISLPN